MLNNMKHRTIKPRTSPKPEKTHALLNWYLILIFIVMAFISATMLRVDHIRMVDLLDTVLAADEVGNTAKTDEALTNLRDFVFSHIIINIIEENGNYHWTLGTGVFYLEQQYLRDADKAITEAEKSLENNDTNENGNIYALAMEVCKPLAIANRWRWNSRGYIDCMTSEIEKYPASDNIQDQIMANVPSTELYRREYTSPIWAPCLTGAIILITLVLALIIIIRFLIWLVLQITILFI